MIFIVHIIDSAEYLFILLFLSLIYFRILRWCWRGYGAAGVIVIISTSFSAIVILSSLGLTSSAGYDVFEMANTGWRMLSLYLICWFRDALKPKTQTELKPFSVFNHTRIEVAMRGIYGIIIPLVRRVRVDRNESALLMLKNVLHLDSSLERPISLACKALGFDKTELIHVADVDSALVVLQNVNTDWGNFSRLDFGVLLVLSTTWVMSMLLTVWAFVNGVLGQNALLFSMNFILPTGIVLLLSLAVVHKPGEDYDLAKRHDEPFRFTHSEFRKRRILDLLVVITALAGATGVTLLTLIVGVYPSDISLLAPLSAMYILSLALLGLDDFLRGQLPLPEESLVRIRRRFLDIIPQATTEANETA